MLPEATLGSGRPPDDSAQPVGRRAERKKAAHAMVHELLAQGHSRRAIARHLGWGLNTVLRYANAALWQDTFRENRPRSSRLDPYKPYLERRFAAGCTSVTHLHSELVADDAPVTYQMVRSHIATLRGAPARAPVRPPTVRQVTGWLTRHPTTLTEEDRTGLKEVLARCPNWTRPRDASATSARYSPTDSVPRSPPGSTQSTPASYRASPASHCTCFETSTP